MSGVVKDLNAREVHWHQKNDHPLLECIIANTLLIPLRIYLDQTAVIQARSFCGGSGTLAACIQTPHFLRRTVHLCLHRLLLFLRVIEKLWLLAFIGTETSTENLLGPKSLSSHTSSLTDI